MQTTRAENSLILGSVVWLQANGTVAKSEQTKNEDKLVQNYMCRLDAQVDGISNEPLLVDGCFHSTICGLVRESRKIEATGTLCTV